MKNLVLAATLALSLLVASHQASAQIAVPPPTGVTATWAGYTTSGQVIGVSLTWKVDSAATSYNIYRGTGIAPQPPGASTLIATGVTGTKFYDPGITIGVDTYTFYQVTAVNNLGQSQKSAPAIAAQLPAVQTTIQGTILATPGPIPGFITVQTLTNFCPYGDVCPLIATQPINYIVDIRGVVYEMPDGAPTVAFPLIAGNKVVVIGARTGAQSISASTIEDLIPNP